MLDDKDRVAKVAKPYKCCQEAVIIALMKTDRRFIQNIENTCQARPNLRGEADAL